MLASPLDKGCDRDSPFFYDRVAMTDSFKSIRRDFAKGALAENRVPSDPIILLKNWLEDAAKAELADYNAMGLSTVDSDGFPSTRAVLLRDISSGGLCFYTNYKSAKGQELEINPKASLQFFWPDLERQLRIRGLVERLSAEESDQYFASRPRESQIGAWASPQSESIISREFLEQNYQRYSEKFALVKVIPRPEHWGGYRLTPNVFEFWQGRPNRMHDRLRAVLVRETWAWDRLAP